MTEMQDRLANTRVLVAGDVMLDRYWHGDVERVSPEAPVPVVLMGREETRLGGAGNVALNVASLGAGAALMGLVGEDEAGIIVAGLLDGARIDNLLHADRDVPTIVKLRINGRSQQLLRVDFESPPGDAALGNLDQRFDEACAGSQAVVLSDYGKGGLRRIASMIACAKARGLPVLIDPKGSDYRPYRGADAITPNRAELAQVVGKWHSEDELVEKVEALRRDLAIGAVLLTRSEEGMSLFDDAGKVDIGAEAREVFDVTGAGDTVIATLAALVGAGVSMREALPHINRAGGIVVGKFGAAPITFGELFG